jgi:hypothetical protein
VTCDASKSATPSFYRCTLCESGSRWFEAQERRPQRFTSGDVKGVPYGTNEMLDDTVRTCRCQRQSGPAIAQLPRHELRGDAVNARSPAARRGGAKRRGIDGVEHSSTVDCAMVLISNQGASQHAVRNRLWIATGLSS